MMDLLATILHKEPALARLLAIQVELTTYSAWLFTVFYSLQQYQQKMYHNFYASYCTIRRDSGTSPSSWGPSELQEKGQPGITSHPTAGVSLAYHIYFIDLGPKPPATILSKSAQQQEIIQVATSLDV